MATELSIRHDNGSQYTSDAFQNELRLLGAQSSPCFVRSTEGNGCAERFIRTHKLLNPRGQSQPRAQGQGQ